MKNILAMLLCLVLAGCAATGDLNSSGTLPYADQEVVRALAESAKRVCVTYTYREGPANTPVTGNMSARDLPEVKRFYRSGGSLVKATTVINGIWGNVYFDPPTSRMACGDEGW